MDKTVLLSKTFWFGVVTALLPLYPPALNWFIGHPDVTAQVWGALIIALRLLTKGKVTLLP